MRVVGLRRKNFDAEDEGGLLGFRAVAEGVEAAEERGGDERSPPFAHGFEAE